MTLIIASNANGVNHCLISHVILISLINKQTNCLSASLMDDEGWDAGSERVNSRKAIEVIYLKLYGSWHEK